MQTYLNNSHLYIQQMINNYISKLNNNQLIINRDELLTNLQFADQIAAQIIRIHFCKNVNFQIAPKFLVVLSVQSSGLTDLNGIQNMNLLKELNLGYNKISDIGRIRGLKMLEKVNLQYNEIVDISQLKYLKLIELDVTQNKIIDASAVNQIQTLDTLYAEGNYIMNEKELQKHTNYNQFELGYQKTPTVQQTNQYKRIKAINSTQIQLDSMQTKNFKHKFLNKMKYTLEIVQLVIENSSQQSNLFCSIYQNADQ
ncbi:leucine-rich_repeat domain-containing protein [Hexamita inflata]|uniref:Leucine-rich repeat domain-containing protein n=1 Tax=Hexamita inflata TaxID=28002 RepID=A0AA86U6M5_9EUKA|nr:leucine-rich repeat domain-containing protein [Hexamita inflata]